MSESLLEDLPTSIRTRLRPGSRSTSIAWVVQHESQRLGYGPTVGEARAAYEAAGFEPQRSRPSCTRFGAVESSSPPGARLH